MTDHPGGGNGRDRDPPAVQSPVTPEREPATEEVEAAAPQPAAPSAPTTGIISKGPAPQLLEIRFKGKRREFFTAHLSPPIAAREYVVVEADRGQDLGTVTAIGGLARQKCQVCEGCDPNSLPARRALRRAAPVDVERLITLRSEEDDIRKAVRDMVKDQGQKMKVSDAEWQWDRNKLIVYFTADKRVDFRILVRNLAKQYRTRIELKQIGVRDEAKRLDGVGRCGRELCSSNWLPELKPVTLQLAKDQNLSLNPSQISGACGRLMCSLRFEHDFYVQTRKRFPKEGRQVRTSVGDETVVAINLFANRVTLRSQTGEVRTLALEELKQETAEARRSARKT
ncbi:MAG TPA: regulatory iron-sulfur-containing complex subunit RicT [Gemmatimonadota bacterium]|nr:regulatory iron-sulfur-containing complex subunit RicT [Gemmatimonadota bacterium]